MGRKRNIFVRDFFDYDYSTKSSVCKACSSKFMGENITNLKRHMIQAHIELYKQETEECGDGSMEDKKNKQKIKFSIEISNKEITDSCLEFVINHSIPLTFFESSAFRLLTQQMFEGLKMQPINSQSIREILNNRYFQIKTQIVRSIKGSFVSIILDKVTLQRRTVLCINMQIVENKKLVIYTLAVRDIENETTDMEFIKSLLEKVLDEFEIGIQHIYTITMENSGNIIQDLEVSQEQEDVGEEYILTPDLLKPTERPLCKEEQILNANDDDVLLLADMLNHSSIITLKTITDVIQLSVEDFFSEPDIEYIIKNSRWIIETLTAPSFRNTLQLLNIKKPLKDQAKSWITTFKMLETLLNIKDSVGKTTTTDPLEKEDVKDVLSQHIKDPFKQINCLDIEELVLILRPVYECTTILHKQQLFLVDFYKSWLNLKSNLKSNSSERSSFLYSCLKKRECQLFNKEVLNSARFLDPLLYRTLNPYEKDNARTHLKELVAKIIKIKPRNNSTRCKDSIYSKPSTSSSSQNYIWDDSSNLSLLKELSVNSTSKEDMESRHNRDIQAASNEIDLYNPPLLDVDLMEYWDSKKYILPYLKKLAYVIHAVPIGQVSMEKALTALQFKLDKEREELSDDLLDTIMFIKLNQNSEE